MDYYVHVTGRHVAIVCLTIVAMVLTLLIVPVLLPIRGDSGGKCWPGAFRCERTNLARENNDRPGLVQHADLQNVAELWARSMALSGSLQHNPDLAAQMPTGSGSYGENVGFGPDWKTVFAAFKASPGHWANILDRDYRRLGIGSQRDTEGRLWIVMVFAAT